MEDPAPAVRRQFVLLEHLMPALGPRPSHWDFMLESGQQLLTFELRQLPASGPLVGGECRAPSGPLGLAVGADAGNGAVAGRLWVTRLADHRRHYLSYRGPLSAGADGQPRGSVREVAAGWAQPLMPLQASHERYGLSGPSLQADIEFQPCDVGHATLWHIHRWQWLTT